MICVAKYFPLSETGSNPDSYRERGKTVCKLCA